MGEAGADGLSWGSAHKHLDSRIYWGHMHADLSAQF